MTLQQEAEEHLIIQNWKEFNEHTPQSADMLKCYIAGANSEHVKENYILKSEAKREKIEFAIEQLKDIDDYYGTAKERRQELEKQLQ